jgi:glycine/D-amino acid oxidase-like deaminating enzyme
MSNLDGRGGMDEYNVVVVGGRVAGASTALLLARVGHGVLAVDRVRYLADTLSTQLLWPAGVAGSVFPTRAFGAVVLCASNRGQATC